MFRSRAIPSDHPPFSALPIEHVTVRRPGAFLAVHFAGDFNSRRTPLVCLPGYHRNMSDFSQFLGLFHSLIGEDWPVLLVDLQGRGRASNRRRADDYSSLADADDLSALADRLGFPNIILLGQGYGGQVGMVLGAQRPSLLAGAVLIDSGPITDSRGLVRLRNNLHHLSEARGERVIQSIFRQSLSADYPGISAQDLNALSQRTHVVERGRARPLFDTRLLKRFESIELDDVLVAQWSLFAALKQVPLLLLRTQLTDQLRRETFDQMIRRRPDATALVISGQGSPALLDHADEVNAIVDFVVQVGRRGEELDMRTIDVTPAERPPALPALKQALAEQV